jgi:hypothetical protein
MDLEAGRLMPGSNSTFMADKAAKEKHEYLPE